MENLIKITGKTYQERKESARQAAIEWQGYFDNSNYSWLELCAIAEYFEKIGRRYGLLKEFFENCII